ITDNEQKQLRTIISETERHKRELARDEARRRAKGAIARVEYESKVRKDELREQVKKLNHEGVSQRKIAEQVGVSRSRVQQILREVML
ncbi:helix-turn-helix domain-containing protein, partial [Endozoicomonas sp. SM1973]